MCNYCKFIKGTSVRMAGWVTCVECGKSFVIPTLSFQYLGKENAEHKFTPLDKITCPQCKTFMQSMEILCETEIKPYLELFLKKETV